MDGKSVGILYLLLATSFAIPLTYTIDDNSNWNSINNNGNLLSNADLINFLSKTIDGIDNYDENNIGRLNDGEMVKRDQEVPQEIYENLRKRNPNIISALRSKMRRSSTRNDDDYPNHFSPALSVDALSNLQGFFSNLAHNMDEIESKNLLPNQMRLLGEAAYRDPGTYGHSAAFLHAVRNYRPSKNIRTLVEYEPDSHKGSNFYNPVLNRIGLGK